MPGNTKTIVRDAQNIAAPQYFNPVTDQYEYAQGSNGAIDVQLKGSILAEEKTQSDAVSGTVTFSGNITGLRFIARDGVEASLTVNGITFTVPAGLGYEGGIAGTPGNTVTVVGSTDYIVQRLV